MLRVRGPTGLGPRVHPGSPPITQGKLALPPALHEGNHLNLRRDLPTSEFANATPRDAAYEAFLRQLECFLPTDRPSSRLPETGV